MLLLTVRITVCQTNECRCSTRANARKMWTGHRFGGSLFMTVQERVLKSCRRIQFNSIQLVGWLVGWLFIHRRPRDKIEAKLLLFIVIIINHSLIQYNSSNSPHHYHNNHHLLLPHPLSEHELFTTISTNKSPFFPENISSKQKKNKIIKKN